MLYLANERAGPGGDSRPRLFAILPLWSGCVSTLASSPPQSLIVDDLPLILGANVAVKPADPLPHLGGELLRSALGPQADHARLSPSNGRLGNAEKRLANAAQVS
jgi:hypothetical protein